MSAPIIARTRRIGIAGIVAAMLIGAAGSGAHLLSSGPAAFMGASPGEPVAFELVTLPPVVESSFNDHPAVVCSPFTPTFDELLHGETIITSEAQMKHVWRRLFDAPYDPSLFDFDNTFVVLAGGGLMHPFFGFDIQAVETFTASFEAVINVDSPMEEPGLAVLIVTTIPGAKPPKKDPVWKLAAVKVDIEHFGQLVANRQDLPLP